MSVLYRKYRPQTFSEVVGQEHIKKIITEAIKKGAVAHAFLFTGPRGVGKTTIARILAKSLNCQNRKAGEFDPCNNCNSCQAINRGSDLDIIEIDAASHTGVDNVRENIISVSRIAPAPNKYKVFIIDEVHMLSTSAFNALLKTLEEPPKNVIFVLATTEIHKVPPTIISRCQRFDFRKIKFSDIIERLNNITEKEGIKVDRDVLKNIAYNSEGCLRDAESLLNQVLSLGDKQITKEQAEIAIPTTDLNLVFSLIESFVQRNASGGIKITNKALNEGVDLSKMAQHLIELFRKILLIKINPELKEFTQEFDEKNKEKIKDFSNNLKEKDIFSIIEILNKRLPEIKSSKIPQLPLEMAVVEICLLGGEIKKPETKKAKPAQNEAEEVKRGNFPADGGGKEETKNIKLQDIQFIWSRVVEGAKKFNNSLSSILQTSVLKKFSNNTLTLAFKYGFHQKKISELKNKNIVEGLIKDNIGNLVVIDPVFDETIKNEKDLTKNEEVLESINDVFGNKVGGV